MLQFLLPDLCFLSLERDLDLELWCFDFEVSELGLRLPESGEDLDISLVSAPLAYENEIISPIRLNAMEPGELNNNQSSFNSFSFRTACS